MTVFCDDLGNVSEACDYDSNLKYHMMMQAEYGKVHWVKKNNWQNRKIHRMSWNTSEFKTQPSTEIATCLHLQGWQLEYVHLGLQWRLGWRLALSAHWGAVRVQGKCQTRDWRGEGENMVTSAESSQPPSELYWKWMYEVSAVAVMPNSTENAHKKVKVT